VGEHGAIDFERIARSDLATGERIDGPIVVEQDDSTTTVMPGWVATEHATGAMIVERLR
jgi:N-methylhydantoinase A